MPSRNPSIPNFSDDFVNQQIAEREKVASTQAAEDLALEQSIVKAGGLASIAGVAGMIIGKAAENGVIEVGGQSAACVGIGAITVAITVRHNRRMAEEQHRSLVAKLENNEAATSAFGLRPTLDSLIANETTELESRRQQSVDTLEFEVPAVRPEKPGDRDNDFFFEELFPAATEFPQGA